MWKALQYTKGNANVALTLIGICGHDDKRQGLFKTPKSQKDSRKKDFKIFLSVKTKLNHPAPWKHQTFLEPEV